MSLPVSARVEATPNFLGNLDAAQAFFVAQDAESAAERFGKLKAELRDMVAILAWSPASGRPARFLNGRSAQARIRKEVVLELARQAGLPMLREHVLSRHVALYAHSDDRVVLLALKHQRELMYCAEV